jgi:hypothetical protein
VDSVGYSVAATTASDGEVTVRVMARGEGTHSYELRADNLALRQATRTVVLRRGVARTIEWKARPHAARVPWIAVVIPDGDVAKKREVIPECGAAPAMVCQPPGTG